MAEKVADYIIRGKLNECIEESAKSESFKLKLSKTAVPSEIYNTFKFITKDTCTRFKDDTRAKVRTLSKKLLSKRTIRKLGKPNQEQCQHSRFDLLTFETRTILELPTLIQNSHDYCLKMTSRPRGLNSGYVYLIKDLTGQFKTHSHGASWNEGSNWHRRSWMRQKYPENSGLFSSGSSGHLRPKFFQRAKNSKFIG